MFRKLFISFIIFLIGSSCFCQDSILISKEELKLSCLIFAEHQKLSTENPLLKQQISSLEELVKLYIESDSLQREEIKIYEDKVSSDAKKIKKLKSTRKGIIIGSSVGGIVLFIIGLIL